MRRVSEYTLHADEFMKRHNATMTISHINDGYGGWKTSQMTGGWLYKVRIDRNGKTWKFDFSDSIYNRQHGMRPTKYDVLACLTKYEYDGDVLDFATEFGYDVSTREAREGVRRTYKAVQKEYKNVLRMFGDCIDELVEIY